MPQIMIDTAAASVAELREAAKFLTACANLRDGTDPNPFQNLPAGKAPEAKPVAPSIPPPPILSIVPESGGAPVPVGTIEEAVLKAEHTHTPLPPLDPGTEFDSVGMPYDARIHQSGKGRKKNGEWKLKKNIELSVVEAVTKELTARKSITTIPAAEPASAASAPPPPPPPPPAPAATVAAPPPPPLPPPSPVASASSAEAAPAAASAPTVSFYRGLMLKIVKATQAGKITQEEVTSLVAKHGAPSLVMLNSMPHLIPKIEADLDILLLERA